LHLFVFLFPLDPSSSHVSSITLLPSPALKATRLTPKQKLFNSLGIRKFSQYTSADSYGKAVFYGIIGANVLVFILWHTVGSSREGSKLMQDHFTVSTYNMINQRYHTLVTSCFSQRDPFHLLVNMVGFWVFGSEVLAMIGPSRFLGLYLMAGVASTASHIFHHLYKNNGSIRKSLQYDPPGLGASGSINAMSVIFALSNPMRILYLNFFIPVPAIVAVGAFLAYDVYMSAKSQSRISHAGHVGGAAVGALYYATVVRNLRRF